MAIWRGSSFFNLTKNDSKDSLKGLESFDFYGTKKSFEWEQCVGENPVIHSGYEDASHVEIPETDRMLPEQTGTCKCEGSGKLDRSAFLCCLGRHSGVDKIEK